MKFISTWCAGFSVYVSLLLVTGSHIFTGDWWLMVLASVLAQAGWGCGITYLSEQIRARAGRKAS